MNSQKSRRKKLKERKLSETKIAAVVQTIATQESKTPSEHNTVIMETGILGTTPKKAVVSKCDKKGLVNATKKKKTFVVKQHGLSKSMEEGTANTKKENVHTDLSHVENSSVVKTDLTFNSMVKTVINAPVVQKKFKCKVCEAEFWKEQELSKHTILHKVRTYDCSKCDEKFATMRALTKHLHVHDDAQRVISSYRPHDCDKCGEKFETENQLLVHLRLHEMKETDYICAICSVKYQHLSELYQHIAKSHPEEKQQVLRCSDCGTCFNQLGEFRIHLLKVHKMNSKEASLACRNKGVLPEEYKQAEAEKLRLIEAKKRAKGLLLRSGATIKKSRKVTNNDNTMKNRRKGNISKTTAGAIKAKAVIHKRKQMKRILRNASTRISPRKNNSESITLDTVSISTTNSLLSESLNASNIIDTQVHSTDASTEQTLENKENFQQKLLSMSESVKEKDLPAANQEIVKQNAVSLDKQENEEQKSVPLEQQEDVKKTKSVKRKANLKGKKVGLHQKVASVFKANLLSKGEHNISRKRKLLKVKPNDETKKEIPKKDEEKDASVESQTSLPSALLENIFDRVELVKPVITESQSQTITPTPDAVTDANQLALKKNHLVEDFEKLRVEEEQKRLKLKFESAERTARMLIRNQRRKSDDAPNKSKHRKLSEKITSKIGNTITTIERIEPLKVKVHVKMMDFVTPATEESNEKLDNSQQKNTGRRRKGKKRYFRSKSKETDVSTQSKRKRSKYYVYEDELLASRREQLHVLDDSVDSGIGSFSSSRGLSPYNDSDTEQYVLPPDIDYDKEYDYLQRKKEEIFLTEDDIMSSLMTLSGCIIEPQIRERMEQVYEKEIHREVTETLVEMLSSIDDSKVAEKPFELSIPNFETFKGRFKFPENISKSKDNEVVVDVLDSIISKITRTLDGPATSNKTTINGCSERTFTDLDTPCYTPSPTSDHDYFQFSTGSCVQAKKERKAILKDANSGGDPIGVKDVDCKNVPLNKCEVDFSVMTRDTAFKTLSVGIKTCDVDVVESSSVVLDVINEICDKVFHRIQIDEQCNSVEKHSHKESLPSYNNPSCVNRVTELPIPPNGLNAQTNIVLNKENSASDKNDESISEKYSRIIFETHALYLKHSIPASGMSNFDDDHRKTPHNILSQEHCPSDLDTNSKLSGVETLRDEIVCNEPSTVTSGEENLASSQPRSPITLRNRPTSHERTLRNEQHNTQVTQVALETSTRRNKHSIVTCQSQSSINNKHSIATSQSQSSMNNGHLLENSQLVSSMNNKHPIETNQSQSSMNNKHLIATSQSQSSMNNGHLLENSQLLSSMNNKHLIETNQSQSSMNNKHLIATSQSQCSMNNEHLLPTTQLLFSMNNKHSIATSQSQSSMNNKHSIFTSQSQSSVSKNSIVTSQSQSRMYLRDQGNTRKTLSNEKTTFEQVMTNDIPNKSYCAEYFSNTFIKEEPEDIDVHATNISIDSLVDVFHGDVLSACKDHLKVYSCDNNVHDTKYNGQCDANNHDGSYRQSNNAIDDGDKNHYNRDDNIVLSKSFLCGKTTYEQSDILSSQRNVCEYCRRTFRKESSLKQHKLTHLNSLRYPFRCITCDSLFEKCSEYINHKNECSQVANLQNRIETNETVERSLCEGCGKYFSSTSHLKLHQKNIENCLKCHFCLSEFCNVVSLKSHIASCHGMRERLTCNKCFKKCKSRKNLSNHKCIETHTCKICQVKYSSRKVLIRHELFTHSQNQSQFKCPICARAFIRPSYLEVHKRSHDGILPYRCLLCSELFRHEKLLAIHKKKKHR